MAEIVRILAVPEPVSAINVPHRRCREVVRRYEDGTPPRLCPRLHRRPAAATPGRRPPRRRLLPGVHRDGQRRPHRPAHPLPGPRPTPARRHPGRLELDRLGRSLRHLVDTVTGLAERGVGFRSLQESIDTTTPGGKLVFHVFAALAEFERDLIRERTTAGLAAARTRGRNGGRPPVLDPDQVELARELYASRRYTTAEIARRLKVGRSTLYRYLEQEQPIR
jgi:DNA-binding CsgD family transcriptional regulator